MQAWLRSKASSSWQDNSAIIDLDQGSEIQNKIRPNQKQIVIVILKWVLTATIFGVITFFTLFSIDFNAHVTLKGSLIQYDSGELSPTCFSQQHSTIPATAKKNGIIPSVPLIEDDVCFDFASLLTTPMNTTMIYHTFWSGKQQLMTELELASVRSFIATQQQQSVLYLWTPTQQDQLQLEKQLQHSRIKIKVITEDDIIQDTPLSSTSWQKNQLLLRLMSLYKYGGVWFDLNTSIFIRDMSPLLAQEWISTSHCLKQGEFDGSFMYFLKSSPFLCEMLAELNNEKTITTASKLYARVYYRLLHFKITTWSILPWCFTDPSQCKKSNSLPNIFSSSNFNHVKLNKVFAFHWHTSGSSREGSIFNYLVKQHKQIVGW